MPRLVPRLLFAILFAALAALAHAPIAHAGPVEQLVLVAAHPSDPDVFLLRYEFGGEGMFVTRDGGASFALICNSAIDPALTRGGPMAIANDGTAFMGIFQGLWQDDGKRCGWNKEPAFEGRWVSDLSHDPLDPALLYATTSSGNEGSQNGIYRRDAEGNWTALGALEEVLISRARVVEHGAGGRRIYASILDGTLTQTIDGVETEVPNYLVRHSDDDGASWQTFPFTARPGTFRLEEVDPSNSARLVATVARSMAGTTVIVSEDAGETWSDWLELSSFGGIAFAPDGRVWIGDSGKAQSTEQTHGLFTAEHLGATTQQLTADYPVHCLRYLDADTLFACQRWKAGRVKTADGSFEETFSFTEVTRFVECDGVDVQSTCEMQLVGAYCGITHFPFAPVCEPYGVDLSALSDDSDSSGCAFDLDAGVGTGTPPDGGCLVPAAQNDAAAPEGDAIDDLLAQNDGAVGGGDDTPPGKPDSSDDGCRAVTPGADNATGGGTALLLLLAAGVLRSRRRRPAPPQS